MTESSAVLLVYEDGRVRDGSAEYAAELARRQGGPLVVLMLIGQAASPPGNDAQRSLDRALQTIGALGLAARGELRRGDKASEFVKFLAQSRRFTTMIWGGHHSVLERSRSSRSRHWLNRVKGEANCPIVTPHSRRQLG